MEWYSSIDADELVVPKDEEALDWLPLADYWSHWENTAYESSLSPKKHCTLDTNSGGEGLNFIGKCFYSEAGINSSVNEGQYSDHSWIDRPGTQNSSLEWTRNSHQLLNYQFGGVPEIDQTERLFLRDSDTGIDFSPGSFDYSTKDQNTMIGHNSYLTDMRLNRSGIPDCSCDDDSLNYLKADTFTPSICWENEEWETSSPSEVAPVPMMNILAEQNGLDCENDELLLLEQKVLHELLKVTSQLTEKTRNSFRDAFYRLANSSKQCIYKKRKEGELMMDNHTQSMVHSERSRLEETKPTEARTNVVDRAVVNLIFNKMDFNLQNLLSTESSTNKKQRPWDSNIL